MVWLAVAAVAALIALDKSLLPGASILGIGALTNILPAKEATGTTLALLIVADWMAIWAYRDSVDWGSLRRLLPNVVLGVGLGALFLFVADNDLTKRVIGVIILVFIGWNVVSMRRERRNRSHAPGRPEDLSGPVEDPEAKDAAMVSDKAPQDAAADEASTRPAAMRRVRGVLFGSLAGFTTMVANAGGPVTAMYFMTERFPVRLFLGTTAWFYLIVNLVKLPFALGLGMLGVEQLPMILAMVPVIGLTVAAGRRLSGRINPTFFNTAIIILTLITGVMLLV
ncbi:MAG: sulfite exporter TauE/SafE family protein [Actinomyces sp.]|jgi:uncharacterized membrane protein YfcA|nr:sulfite exporter TauE/SafE family protein [Actinomyces sp.]MCI1661520.1 sulfite exporter TauE/SafE family protein [Actinomyces sp.]